MSDKQTGIVDIRGKQYQTVALRIANFRAENPVLGLETEIFHIDDSAVIMRAVISDDDGRIIATGHAEEIRGSSNINKTSALENAETSAIGRALAAFGYGGTEFASANEVQEAIAQQDAWPEGPHSGIHALKTHMRGLPAKMEACKTQDELAALRKAEDATREQALKTAIAHWWIGDDGDIEGADAAFDKRHDQLEVPTLIAEIEKLQTKKALATWEKTNLERVDALPEDGATEVSHAIKLAKERIEMVDNVRAG